jgi:pyruvate dehydrogenase (quinone)
MLLNLRGEVLPDAIAAPLALAMPSHVPLHTMKGYTLSVAKLVLSGRMNAVIETIERNVGLV